MSVNKLSEQSVSASPTMSEAKKQSIIDQLWLTYYNDTLYEKGIITEAERNKMRVKIKNRRHSLER